MGAIADQLKQLSDSIAESKVKIEELRSQCPHTSKRATDNQVAEAGHIYVHYVCAECGVKLSSEPGGLMCITDQVEMEVVPCGHDSEADVVRAKEVRAIEPGSYNSVVVFRCPTCKKLETTVYYDK